MARSNGLVAGRPDNDIMRFRARMAQLIKQVWTDDDVIEVLDHLGDMAKTSGDIQWTTLFLAYAMGKPASVDPTLTGIQVDGDLTLTINQLSLEQLTQAEQALKTIDATFSSVNRSRDVLPVPSSQ